MYYRRAIAVRDSVFPNPHQDRAHSRSNLSYVLGYLNELDSAVIVIREANALFDALPAYDSLNYLQNLNQLAYLAKEKRDFRLAYSATYRAVSLVDQLPDLGQAQRFFIFHNGALTMLRMDQLDEALEYAKRAALAAKNLPDPLDLAATYNLLAIIQRERGDTAEGFANLKRAEAMITPENSGASVFGDVYLNLAEYYGGEDDVRNFDTYRRRARGLFEASDLRVFYISEKFPRSF